MFIRFVLVAVLLAFGASGAHAKPRHHQHVHAVHTHTIHTGLGPRPGRWCGWWMRQQLGGGPAYNLAWAWSRWGLPSSPQVGAVVVWPHHVGLITGETAKGKWLVTSGNDGGRVRERVRSLRGAVIRRGGAA